MQSFLRAKRDESVPSLDQAKTGGSRVVPVTPKQSYTKFKLSSWSRKSKKSKDPSFVSKETATEISGPVRRLQEVQLLLNHYNTSYTINSFALNSEGTWISFTFMDPALLNATLGLVAIHRNLLISHSEATEALVYKGLAIQAINRRFSSRVKPANDENLGVVALLVKFETLRERSDASKAHMQGLVEMIKIRGGLRCITHNPVLVRVLMWIDLLYATTWKFKPCIVASLPRQEPLAEILQDIVDVPVSPIEQYILSLGMFSFNEGIDFDTFKTVQQISAAKTNMSELALESRKITSHAIYLVNHRLVSSFADAIPSWDPSHDLYTAFWASSLLYLYLMVREIPRRGGIHWPIKQLLRTLLSDTFTIKPITHPMLQVVAWIGFLGVAASPPEEGDTYFIDLLVLASVYLKVKDEKDLKSKLQGVLWIDDICDRYLAIVWAEMGYSHKEGTVL
ncbi:hypothetical protein BP6252_02966 [Coleophoma cylindrospora]|uniref:Uncharacterized protein n=1 Tax=Coleophoma cylindrospora TaxID=1849047 RepID=A0A3D8S736_9HELO|nr:hypothetical protein BP6252_02966 [Coleophoma cylindrospora]